MKPIWIVALLSFVVLSPLAVGPASAATVDVTLIAKDVKWHVGTETAAEKPTISVAPGDSLHLRIENLDGFNHTFTAPHFNVDAPMAANSVIFVNITTSTADNGKWQFYCDIAGHSFGTYPNRDGMIGWIQVATPTPPTPGFEVLAAIGALAAAFVVVRVRRRVP